MKKLQTLLSLFFTLLLVGLFLFWYGLRTTNLSLVLTNIDAELENLTQLPVHIDGDLKFKFFPSPACHISHMEIGTKGPDSPYFIELDDLSLKLKLKPLLQKKIIFKKIQADRFYIQFHRLEKLSTSASGLKTQTPPLGSTLEIDEIVLSQGKIEATLLKVPVTFSQIQLNALQVSLKQAFPLQMKAQVTYPLAEGGVVSTPANFRGQMKFPIDCLHDPAHCFNYLDLNGQLRLDELKIGKIQAVQINTTLQTKSNTLLFNPLLMSLFNGESYGDVSIDLNQNKIFLNQTATNMNGALFFKQLFQRPISGNLDVSLHGHMNLDVSNPINTLSGNGSLNLKEGQIKQFNLNLLLDLVRKKIHQLLNPGLPTEPETHIMNNPRIYLGQTPFRLLAMQFSIQQSLLYSPSFVFQTEALQLKGDLSFNMSSQEINAKLYAHLDTGDPQLNKIQQLIGGAFPLHAQGKISNITMVPDTSKIIPFMNELMIQKTVETPLRVIQDQLKNLFNPLGAGQSNDPQ